MAKRPRLRQKPMQDNVVKTYSPNIYEYHIMYVHL